MFLTIGVVYGVIELDDYLTTSLIHEQIRILNNKNAVDRAIQYGYPRQYKSLDELRIDYPDFVPEVEHWSEYGSAILYYSKVGWGLGRFSISLPDMLVVIDENGNPEATRRCGTVEGYCELVPPRNPEFGITGALYYRPQKGVQLQLAVPAVTGTWSGGKNNKLVVRNNCFWAYTENATTQKLTIQSEELNLTSLDYQKMYGYYRIKANYEMGGDGKAWAWEQRERISRDVFLNETNCSAGVDSN